MRINHEYRLALKGGKWVAKWDRMWLKNRIREEQECGVVSGICFIVIVSWLIVLIGGAL